MRRRQVELQLIKIHFVCRCDRVRQQFQLPALQEDLVRHRRGTAGNLGRCHTAKTAASLAY